MRNLEIGNVKNFEIENLKLVKGMSLMGQRVGQRGQSNEHN